MKKQLTITLGSYGALFAVNFGIGFLLNPSGWWLIPWTVYCLISTAAVCYLLDRFNSEASNGRHRTDSPEDRPGADAGLSATYGALAGYAAGGTLTVTSTNPLAVAAAAPKKKRPQAFDGLNFDLAVGEVYGLRAWRIDDLGRLRALHVDTAPRWRPGVNRATCQRVADATRIYGALGATITGATSHPAPQEDCKCGFYAYTDPRHEEITEYPRPELVVLGIVKGSGNTLIGTRGFRCEKAEIVALLDPAAEDPGPSRSCQRDRLVRAYPDIPLLPSRADLLAFAPIEPQLPDPSSDEFWELP